MRILFKRTTFSHDPIQMISFLVDLSYIHTTPLPELVSESEAREFPTDFIAAQNHNPTSTWVLVKQLE